MDLERLERMAKSVQKDMQGLSGSFRTYRTINAKFKNLMAVAPEALIDNDEFFKSVLQNLENFDNIDARQAIEYILELVNIEKSSQAKIKGLKIFESVNDKQRQATICFRNNDYPSTFHNLNTALELILKEKLGIPITITKINTSTIIDILTKHKVELHPYLSEAKKRVVMIDNKIKHQGYSPSKIDCINGMKAMEELISKLRDKEMKLTEDIKNKIYQGL